MSGQALADPGQSHAVLIGVHRYQHLEALPAVRNNLVALADALCDPRVWGLPPDNCVTVAEEAAGSSAMVLDVVEQVAARTTGTLLVYYAGHGLLEAFDEFCLALPHSRGMRPSTALRYQDLRGVLELPSVRCRNKIVVLDCCWAGRASLGSMSAGAGLADGAAVEGVCVLAAAAATRQAMAPPGETYTAFTGVLVDVLTNGLPGGPELLDMETLYRHIRSVQASRARPLPELRGRGSVNRICLARNLAPASPHPSPAEAPAQLPPGLPSLVRERLRSSPGTRRFRIVAAGELPARMRKFVRLLALDPAQEEVLAVWLCAFGMIGGRPEGLGLTTRGIRILQSQTGLFIPYARIGDYRFESHWEHESSRGYVGTAYWMTIDGPEHTWTSPRASSGTEAELVTDHLNALKALAAPDLSRGEADAG
ncbi:caspase domain-containing protein [Streptomyces sp. 846.5]|nr:caspase family protein [Streptomyces sp. 846.5]TDT97633.1 caspase domain-containing protein [Streptomyces sp. 846.5]